MVVDLLRHGGGLPAAVALRQVRAQPLCDEPRFVHAIYSKQSISYKKVGLEQSTVMDGRTDRTKDEVHHKGAIFIIFLCPKTNFALSSTMLYNQKT